MNRAAALLKGRLQALQMPSAGRTIRLKYKHRDFCLAHFGQELRLESGFGYCRVEVGVKQDDAGQSLPVRVLPEPFGGTPHRETRPAIGGNPIYRFSSRGPGRLDEPHHVGGRDPLQTAGRDRQKPGLQQVRNPDLQAPAPNPWAI